MVRVDFSDHSEIRNNKFTAVQFSELAIIKTDFVYLYTV